MNQTSEMKTTSATRRHPGVVMRFLVGCGLACAIGLIGAICMIFPPLGIFVLLVAVVAPFYCVFNAACLDTLRGQCPHCQRELNIQWQKARKGGFDCRFCRRRLIISGQQDDERFLLC